MQRFSQLFAASLNQHRNWIFCIRLYFVYKFQIVYNRYFNFAISVLTNEQTQTQAYKSRNATQFILWIKKK